MRSRTRPRGVCCLIPYHARESPYRVRGILQIPYHVRQIPYRADATRVSGHHQPCEEAQIRPGVWVRSHEERRCSNLGPAQSRILPSILYTKKQLLEGAAGSGVCVLKRVMHIAGWHLSHHFAPFLFGRGTAFEGGVCPRDRVCCLCCKTCWGYAVICVLEMCGALSSARLAREVNLF